MLGSTETLHTKRISLMYCIILHPSLLSKNQLDKDGPKYVAAVIIPALAATLDKSLQDDITLFFFV